MRIILIVTSIALLAVLVAHSYASSPVSPKFPEDYRSWTHVKSVLVDEDSPLFEGIGGIHHIYANDLATAVLRGEEPFPYPDGSKIVFDLLSVQTVEGSTSEIQRKSLAVIEKNASAYGETGGWGFARFPGDTREPEAIDVDECFACHEKANDSDFVFTKWRP